MRNFIIITSIFIAAFIAMLLNHVTNWIAWVAFIAIWTLAEWKFAKVVHLKWWHWAAIIAGLAVIDFIALALIK